MTKEQLRKKMIAMLRESPVGPSPILVRQKLCSLPEYASAQMVLGYVPMKGEIDVSLVMDQALKDGKTIGFPDHEPGLFRLGDSEWRDYLVQLDNRTYTLDSLDVLNFRSIDSNITKCIILVPGLSFTEFGARLGRGAGYYDQLFALMVDSPRFADFITIGVCRETQLVESLPQQPYDRNVRMAITF